MLMPRQNNAIYKDSWSIHNVALCNIKSKIYKFGTSLNFSKKHFLYHKQNDKEVNVLLLSFAIVKALSYINFVNPSLKKNKKKTRILKSSTLQKQELLNVFVTSADCEALISH